MRGFFEQVVVAFTNIDSQLLRSLSCLVTRPGVLTLAYLNGQRRPYIRPLQLFLLANVLFFAVESFTNSTIFSTPLDGHLNSQPWDGLAQILVPNRLAALHTTLELYAPVFDSAIALNARTLVILMAFAFAPFLFLSVFRNQLPFVVNVVFSLHLYAFILLMFSGALVLVSVSTLLGGPGLMSDVIDKPLSIALVIACAVYLYVATGTVYGETGAARTLKVAALTVAVAAIVLGYRFALLLITLYSTFPAA